MYLLVFLEVSSIAIVCVLNFEKNFCKYFITKIYFIYNENNSQLPHSDSVQHSDGFLVDAWFVGCSCSPDGGVGFY